MELEFDRTWGQQRHLQQLKFPSQPRDLGCLVPSSERRSVCSNVPNLIHNQHHPMRRRARKTLARHASYRCHDLRVVAAWEYFVDETMVTGMGWLSVSLGAMVLTMMLMVHTRSAAVASCMNGRVQSPVMTDTQSQLVRASHTAKEFAEGAVHGIVDAVGVGVEAAATEALCSVMRTRMMVWTNGAGATVTVDLAGTSCLDQHVVVTFENMMAQPSDCLHHEHHHVAAVIYAVGEIIDVMSAVGS